MKKIRECQLCGIRLPENAPAARKYCPECSELHSRELQRIRRRKLAAEKETVRKEIPQQRVPDEIDRKYCQHCKYSGVYTEDYLCNYILKTGTRRGCKAGAGCTKRVLKAEE